MRLKSLASATALFVSMISPALATSCNTVVACVLGQNSSPGASSDIGVEGLSQFGFGLVGVTSANPVNASGRVAGLYGKDQGATPYNSGVSAFSQNGTGLIAFGVNGDGIHGYATAGASGVATSAILGEDDGQNSASDGVTGTSTYGTGVAATSTHGNAFEAVAQNVGDGVFASSANGDALYSITHGSGDSLRAIGGALGQVVEIDTIGTGPLVAAFNTTFTNGGYEFGVDANGNEFLAGNLTTNGGTYARTRSIKGTDVASYGARSASPTQKISAKDRYGKDMVMCL